MVLWKSGSSQNWSHKEDCLTGSIFIMTCAQYDWTTLYTLKNQAKLMRLMNLNLAKGSIIGRGTVIWSLGI